MCHVCTRAVVSSCTSDHAVILSVHGDAYLYGRNAEAQCGVPVTSTSDAASLWLYDARRLDKEHDFVPPIAPGVSIHTGATGAMHTLLVTTQGELYAAGSNEFGQCGLGALATCVPFQLVPMTERVVDVACGRAASVVVTESGAVYTMGSSEDGMLGICAASWHHTGPSDVTYDLARHPVRIPNLDGIVRVTCGERHVAALDHDGYMYVWGHASLARLGCGTQSDQPFPVRIPQFVRKNKQDRIRDVVAGTTYTMCVDNQERLWMAGTWRLKDDGGPDQSFLIYKPLAELADYDVHEMAAGADTMQCLVKPTGEHGNTRMQAWGWGEGAWHAELGSRGGTTAPVPTLLNILEPLRVVSVASGRYTSYWLVQPDSVYAELPRYPATIESSSVCMVCRRSGDDDDATLLECDRCENPYHLSCLTPPLAAVPEGEWLCVECRKDSGHNDDGNDHEGANHPMMNQQHER